MDKSGWHLYLWLGNFVEKRKKARDWQQKRKFGAETSQDGV